MGKKLTVNIGNGTREQILDLLSAYPTQTMLIAVAVDRLARDAPPLEINPETREVLGLVLQWIENVERIDRHLMLDCLPNNFGGKQAIKKLLGLPYELAGEAREE